VKKQSKRKNSKKRQEEIMTSLEFFKRLKEELEKKGLSFETDPNPTEEEKELTITIMMPFSVRSRRESKKKKKAKE